MIKIALFLSCSCVLIDVDSAPTVAAENVPAELAGIWLAEDIGGGGVIDDLQTTLEINDDGTYSGFAGCNNFTGTFGLNGDEINFGPAGATRKLCPPAVMDQETKFFDALGSELSWRIEGSKLVLARSDSKLAMRLAAHATSADVLLRIPGGDIVDRQTERYDCNGIAVSAEYINAGSVSLVTLAFGKAFVVASNVLSGSGAKYMGAQYIWWTKGDDAMLIDAAKGDDGLGVACAKAQ